jgi:DNA polymerase-3 subunit alpha
MTPKAVVRKGLNCFEHPNNLINELTKLIPDLCPSLEEAYKVIPELLEYKTKFKTEWDVIERLEGVISHESQHAGGVIIYPGLSHLLPIKTRSEDRTKRIVALDMNMAHELGFFKFDILGLETRPVIHRCLESIKEATGEKVDLYHINYEDPKVYDLLCHGDVSGIFQLANQVQKVVEQQPRNFKDLIAINALIRPGTGDWEEYMARRKGKVWTVHPDRLPYLEETEGLITYQEQFLLDCKFLAGWDIAYADKKVRKNKDICNDTELRDKFHQDAKTRGYEEAIISDVWFQIEDAVKGGYSFNKSHSASYARMSYQTAYLKCYYPEHFYASLMSSEKTDGDGQSAISGYITECKQKGIRILPPDINKSGENFVVTDGGVNYRITTIKHVGDSAIESINQLRPITSFEDFLERREKRHIKQNVLVNLIKAGCFDCFNPNRAELLWQVDMTNRTKTQIKEEFECPPYEWNDRIKAEWEKDVLGMYLSVHPMERYGFKPLTSYQDNSPAIQGGEVSDARIFNDKKGREMAFIYIDTLYGQVKVLVFAGTWRYTNIQQTLHLGNLVLIKGRRSGDAII